MAFCGNCGQPLADGVAACPNCGAAVAGFTVNPTPEPTEGNQAQNTYSQASNPVPEPVEGPGVNETANPVPEPVEGPGATNQGQYQQQTQYQQQQGQYQQPQYQQPIPAPRPVQPVAAGVFAYIYGWIGFIICIAGADQTNPYVRFHTNQSLVLCLFGLVSMLAWVPFLNILVIGWSIFMLVCQIIALIGAAKGEMREVPLLGKIRILK